ncbi:hypothetical protein [Enterobacter phage N5822]|nr:hypothetical protein [Enterobacter phage N5822]
MITINLSGEQARKLLESTGLAHRHRKHFCLSH